MAVKPLIYNGKQVIGKKPFTKKQHWIVYWILYTYLIPFFYVIIRAIGGADLYLVGGEGMLVMMITAFVFFWTMLMYRKQERKNYIFKEDEKK